MKKRIMPIALSVLMIFASVASAVSVNAETSGTVYYSDYDSYKAEKITHSEKGVKTADGIVDYTGNGTVTDQITADGVGDRAQSYSWSAVGYGDYVYIGTCANAMTNTLTLMKSALGDNYDEETMKATLNAMYNGTFFVEEEDGGNPQGILIKLNTKTGEVKLLMSKATTGTNCLLRNAVEYNDMLYFCGSVNGIPSIYQVNPKNDEITCVYKSMNLTEYYQAYQQGICSGIRGMCEFDGKLIVSLVGLNGAYICATDDPSNPDSFEVIADMDDLFNYPAYHYSDSIYGGSIWEITEFNNSLYVSICTGTPDNKPDENSMQSFAIVRGDVDENGKWSWTSVIGDKEKDNAKYTFGIDPERTRAGAGVMMVYGDYLYIGEYNDEEIALEDILFSMNCNFVNANLEQSVSLYRMDKDENIELVMGDATEMFPEGSLTGYESGFGRNENQYIWRMQVYDGKLYIGTFDTSSLLEPIGQFTNGDILNMTEEEWQSQINYLKELIAVMQSKQETPEEEITTADVDSSLTSSQKNSVVALANDEEAIENTDSSAIDTSEKINAILTQLEGMLSETTSEEFLALYEQLVSLFGNIDTEMPDTVVNAYKTLISEDTLETISSFLTCAAYMSTAERGFDLYVIDENLNVETVTTNGFGDPYNHGCRVFAVNNSGLSIGTANPFYGTQVWSLESTAYDTYDVNRDGRVNIMDATYVQQAVAGLIEVPDDFDTIGDVNGDGVVNVVDSTEIQKYISQ